MHTPPPLHGASMVGQYIRDSVLVNESFECHYIKPSDAKSLAELKKLRLNKITFLFSFHYRLIKLYRKVKPDLSYFTANSWGLSFYRDFITVMILKLLRAKIVIHFHNKPNPSFRNKLVNRFLYRIFFKRIHVIFAAEQLVDTFRQYIDKEKIYICLNGIPVIVAEPVYKIPQPPRYSFLYISHMMKEKGAWVLLEACALLKNRGYTFHCDFAGRWDDITQELFSKKIMEYGLTEFVQAHGFVDDKKNFLFTADAFVFPSLDEALPLILMEAMECSLPCISTNIGGIPTIIRDEQSGFLVKPNDAAALAEKMIFLIEHPQQSVEMGITGRKIFEEYFTIQKFENFFFNIIKDLVTI